MKNRWEFRDVSTMEGFAVGCLYFFGVKFCRCHFESEALMNAFPDVLNSTHNLSVTLAKNWAPEDVRKALLP